MRLLRTIFAMAGTAAMLWGAWYLADVIRRDRSVLFWLAGGPLVADLLLLPLLGLLGWLAARGVPTAFRRAVGVGAVVSITLVTLSVPYLWRPDAPHVNPGLDDRPYLDGLVVALAAVWLIVLIVAALRVRGSFRHRDGRRGGTCRSRPRRHRTLLPGRPASGSHRCR